MNYLPEYLVRAGDLAKPDPVPTGQYSPGFQHVMSRDANGNIVSVYGDPTWDFSMFVGASPRFHIEDFIQEISSKENADEYRQEFKLILFRFIYSSRARAINSISELFNILKRHVRFAAAKGLSIRESLKERSTLDYIVYNPELDKRQIARRLVDAKVLFSSLHKISTNLDEFDFFPSDIMFSYLAELLKEYPLISLQTPVIPTRILSRRIQICFDYINKFIELKDIYESLFEFRYSYVNSYIRNGGSPKVARDYAAEEFKEEIKKEKYSEFINYFDVKEFQNLRGLSGKVRLPIREMIHAFSGMRNKECNSIAMDGFQLKTIGRHSFPVIRSYTTKMARDSGYFADWVTSPEIERAFQAAKIINFTALRYQYDLTPEQIDESTVPLFLSTDARMMDSNPTGALYDFPLQKPSLRGSKWKKHRINLDTEMIVTNEDIAEILAIDPFASIDSLKPGIEVGKPFEFQSHMYRRSLAVYAARSGLVSLPTLKKQFKHIAIQTSAFYGNDAAFAKNFVLPKSDDLVFDSAVISQRSFIKEFQDELITGQTDVLYDEVITADEIVFGGMGTQIQKQKFSGTLPTVLTDRAKTKKKIKQGRLRYAETPLGGCMATEVCDRIAFSSITTCVGCASSVFNSRTVPLLEKTKEDYERRLELFGTGTPYGRQLERDIRDIETTLKMREKLISSVDMTDGRQ
ncbi:hypothetical protein [Halomonas sp. KRD171]|uniref:hypothetical protein n=1 Tax=Halomonas sp. KRD171 TaxID=2729726 RepID=UPI0019CFFC34|nr:hypothetical protein [Halomonas sp. KRD171]